MNLTPRRTGKSWLVEQAKEKALNAGKRVLVVTQHGATLQRRKKHLTMIEETQRFDVPPNTRNQR